MCAVFVAVCVAVCAAVCVAVCVAVCDTVCVAVCVAVCDAVCCSDIHDRPGRFSWILDRHASQEIVEQIAHPLLQADLDSHQPLLYNMYIYMKICIYIYMYIYIFICIYVYTYI